MKKVVVLFSLAALVFAFASCGGPKADAKKLLSQQEAFVKLQEKAIADEIIDDAEIDKIVETFKATMESSEEMMKKYEEDSVAGEEFTAEIERLTEEMGDKYKDLQENVSNCEGYDKLQEKMFAALFAGEDEE
jgi:pyocin large subunit-like protein